jgi:hypothetical protein
VEEGRQRYRLAGWSESESEPNRVVEHEDTVVVPARRLRIEAEVRLVEVARPLLVGDGEGQMLHVAERNARPRIEQSVSPIAFHQSVKYM